MRTVNGERAYNIHRAMGAHFSSNSYDYTAANGKLKNGDYSKVKTWLFYERIASKYGEEVEEFFASNTAVHGFIDIYSLCNNPVHYQCWIDWISLRDSYSYVLRNKINKIPNNRKQLFEVRAEKAAPLLLTCYFQQQLAMLDLAVLDNINPYCSYYDYEYNRKFPEGHPTRTIWSNLSRKIDKVQKLNLLMIGQSGMEKAKRIWKEHWESATMEMAHE